MPDDNLKWSLISVKGIAVRDGRVALARNTREEWDLPGGKLEYGETLSDCLVREFREELGIPVTWGSVVDAVQHHFHQNIIVIIVGCGTVSENELQVSEKHSEARWFPMHQLDALDIVPHYRHAIDRWWKG